MGFSKLTKTFLGQMFYYFFFHAYETFIFYHFKICSQYFVDLVKIYVLNWNKFQIECNKELFLDINLKTRFFEGQNCQSQQK